MKSEIEEAEASHTSAICVHSHNSRVFFSIVRAQSLATASRAGLNFGSSRSADS